MAVEQETTAATGQAKGGKLGVLLPGMGAVATTFIAGVLAIRRGLAPPIGSLTQMGMIRRGPGPQSDVTPLREYIDLASLDDLVFGGWDIFPDDAYAAACRAGVLEGQHVEQLREELETIRPMKAVFDERYVRRLSGEHVKRSTSKREQAELLIADIERFARDNGCDRTVVIWCGSTEVHTPFADVHSSLQAFERGLDQSDDRIPPSQIYAYAAARLGIPYANGAPNISCDFPAIIELAEQTGAPLAGKDFKTGQTLMKTIVAPGLKARLLGINGWYSTNILGNRDGEVLDDPGSFQSKQVSKLGVLDHILEPQRYPQLYGDLRHMVRIDYYPPRGDAKEGWDNIDIAGWLGYPMQIKVNFLCRDSVLAAPLVLDLALLLDFAGRSGMKGAQHWLSFYFKSPMHPAQGPVEHDLFNQLMRLKNTLRISRGDEPIVLGAEAYD